MTAALLRWWTVPRLNSHLNPSSTGESSTTKKYLNNTICTSLVKSCLLKPARILVLQMDDRCSSTS